MFTQPTPVLSLGSDLQSRSLSSQPPPAPVGEETSLSGWWVLVSTDPLCRNITTLPSAPLLLRSPPWLRSFPPPLPVKGFPSVWKFFLLHSSLPEVQVLSLFFCLCFFFFLLPYPGTWGVSCLLGSLRSSANGQWVFCRSCSTCRYISDVFVGRKVISTSYSSAIFKVSPWIPLISFSCEIVLAKISNTLLNRSSKSRYPYLVPNLWEKAFSFYHYSSHFPGITAYASKQNHSCLCVPKTIFLIK